MSAELSYLFGWVRETLINDGGLPPGLGGRIWPADQVPQHIVTPYLVLLDRGNEDVMTVNGRRIFVDIDFGVEIWDKSEYAAAMTTTMNWVDATLHLKSGTMNGADIMSCVRERQYRRRDDLDTKLNALGMLFHAQVQKL